MKATYTHSEVQTAMYVMCGANDSRSRSGSAYTEQRWSGGHMDMADVCARAAVLADEVYRETRAEEWNGCCWLYEVAEELGDWLFKSGEHTKDSEIKAQTLKLLLAANGLTELPPEAQLPAPEEQPSVWDAMTYDQQQRTLRNMEKRGGGFVHALGEALYHADSENTAKLVAAFPEVIDAYKPTA